MIADYHVHTKLCKHARGEMEEYVESALAQGLTEMAFTDHIPLPDNFDIAHRMDESDLEGYIKKIASLRKAYPGINIKTGIEADFYDGFENYLEKILSRYDFDLVILSVHFVRGWPQGSWAFSYDFPGRRLADIYSDYLQALRRGVDSGLFDIIGHVDLVKSAKQSLLRENADELRSLFSAAARQNMAVEINTSGLRKDIAEPYPNLNMLPLIQQAGLALTLGSDAHRPQQTAFRFAEMEAYLAKFKNLKLAQFEKRKMTSRLFNTLSQGD